MKKTIYGFFVLFLLFLTPPLFAKTCQGSADCDDKDPCTSDMCSNGGCLYFITCSAAEAPLIKVRGGLVDKAALEECKKTCLDEPCWEASCMNDGQCYKMATCIGAEAPPPPIKIKIREQRPSSSPPPPPPPPPSQIPVVPVSPDGVPPTGGDKTLKPDDVEQPLRLCVDVPPEARDCCVKYDDPAQGGDGDGRLNGKELARLVKDETCQPHRPSGIGPSPSIADECSGYFKVFAGEGSNVTVNGFNQCCQILKNKGEATNLTMQQNCENHMGLAAGPAVEDIPGDASTLSGGVTGKPSTDESKADEGGCQLIRRRP